MSEVTISEREVRIAKVHKLRKMWIIPYAQSFSKTHCIDDLKIEKWKKSTAEELMAKWAKNVFKTAGRMISRRTHGKLTFAKIRDDKWDIQICFVKWLFKLNTWTNLIDNISDEWNSIDVYKFVDKFLDVGDFIWVSGDLFITQHGELTIFVNEIQLLSKAIRPLPEKFHWIQDQEEIYRKRYLDMTMNEESYQRFLFKSKFYQTLREFYTQQWFIEIQTPILWNSASWAAAKPFLTHHNDFDNDVYLRIAFETWLKKSTVGRFEKVFEIWQDFRNEWSDPSHIQEFTQVEHYAVYRNYEDNMKFTEKMFDYIFAKLNLSKKLNVKDKNWNIKEVNFKTPRERIDFTKWILKSCWIDITKYTMDDADKLRKDIKSKWIDFEWIDHMWTTTLIDYLYKKVLRPWITWPAFIYNYPVIMQPLARISDKDPSIVEQFQLLVNWWELCKAYSELVDPLLQKENFDKQSEAEKRWDQEITASDDEFLTAMEYWMPPQSGFGMWLERVLAILTQQDNIRDVVMFPLMKPEIKEMWNLKCEMINSNFEKEDNSDSFVYWILPAIQDVENLAKKYLKETYRHCNDVAKVMKYFAKKLNQNEDLRYIAWFLHDIDRDHIGKDPSKHLWEEFEKIVWEIHLPSCLMDDIKSHYTSKTSISVSSLLRRYLISVDELTWFIYAVSLMRPTWLQWMDFSSVKKKLKDKKFAAWVDRQEVLNCEKYLAIPLDQFVPQIIEGMRNGL